VVKKIWLTKLSSIVYEQIILVMSKFSIITATYNRPHLLERMIASVVAQTFTDWELIITDDSTNNETKEIIQKYLSDSRIIYQKNEKNEGLPYSRNRSLDSAQGQWITFLDDDDFYINKSVLDTVIPELTKTSTKWIAFNTVSPNGEIRTKVNKKKDTYNWLTDYLFNKTIQGDSMPFIHRDVIGNTRYYGKNRAEWYFWYELSKKSDLVHCPIAVTQVEYLHDGMSNLGYLKKERIYQGQQFIEMMKQFKTWRYLPIIALRYIASFSFMRKVRVLLINSK
jgi:teichuronic acid biosynthesis glycosyltransferase TuaG